MNYSLRCKLPHLLSFLIALRNDIFGGSKADAFFTVKNQGGFQMKKIIGLALALAAAALVFVGCSDEVGGVNLTEINGKQP